MIAEFALEPSLLHNWDRFQRLVALFGVGQGRLISRFPKKWQEMVLASLTCGPVEKHKITEALIRVRDTALLAREQGVYVPEKPWLDNAIVEHASRPFSAILASTSVAGNDDVIDASDLDATALPPKLRGGPSKIVTRSATEMAAAARVLLCFSKKVLLIDRNFSPDKARFREPLEAMLMCCLDRFGRPRKIEVELHLGHRVLGDAADFKASCAAWLQDVIPVGMRLTVVRWNHDDLHNRYLITDRGGILIGEGLDEANERSTRTDDVLTLLSPEIALELLDRYCGADGQARQQLRHPIAGRKTCRS